MPGVPPLDGPHLRDLGVQQEKRTRAVAAPHRRARRAGVRGHPDVGVDPHVLPRQHGHGPTPHVGPVQPGHRGATRRAQQHRSPGSGEPGPSGRSPISLRASPGVRSLLPPVSPLPLPPPAGLLSGLLPPAGLRLGPSPPPRLLTALSPPPRALLVVRGPQCLLATRRLPVPRRIPAPRWPREHWDPCARGHRQQGQREHRTHDAHRRHPPTREPQRDRGRAPDRQRRRNQPQVREPLRPLSGPPRHPRSAAPVSPGIRHFRLPLACPQRSFRERRSGRSGHRRSVPQPSPVARVSPDAPPHARDRAPPDVGPGLAAAHGRTSGWRSAKRRSPMPLTWRSSSTDRNPLFSVR